MGSEYAWAAAEPRTVYEPDVDRGALALFTALGHTGDFYADDAQANRIRHALRIPKGPGDSVIPSATVATALFIVAHKMADEGVAERIVANAQKPEEP